MLIENFVELEQPTSFSLDFGWYVCHEYDTTNNIAYYLHDDGTVHDYCEDRLVNTTTTGWFPTQEAAVMATLTYYNKHGMIYPYNLADGAGYQQTDPTPLTIQSEEMKF